MNINKSESDKDANMFAMKILSDLRSRNDAARVMTEREPSIQSIQDSVTSAAINRAIDAIYMQNKLIDTIELIRSKDCFVTDSKGVVAILDTLKIGSEKDII